MSDFNTKDGHQLSTVRLNGSNASNQSINTNHNMRCSLRCIPVPAHSDTIVLSSVLLAWPGIHFTHFLHFHLYHLNLNLSGVWVEARPLKICDMPFEFDGQLISKHAKCIDRVVNMPNSSLLLGISWNHDSTFLMLANADRYQNDHKIEEKKNQFTKYFEISFFHSVAIIVFRLIYTIRSPCRSSLRISFQF